MLDDDGLTGDGAASSCPSTPSRPVIYPEATPQELRIIAAFASQLNHTQSEDCLTLNLWSKSTPNRRKAVLVFFHGGRQSPPGPLPPCPDVGDKKS